MRILFDGFGKIYEKTRVRAGTAHIDRGRTVVDDERDMRRLVSLELDVVDD